eukprot:1177030-Prorocentrum_minimum.AAC.2
MGYSASSSCKVGKPVRPNDSTGRTRSIDSLHALLGNHAFDTAHVRWGGIDYASALRRCVGDVVAQRVERSLSKHDASTSKSHDNTQVRCLARHNSTDCCELSCTAFILLPCIPLVRSASAFAVKQRMLVSTSSLVHQESWSRWMPDDLPKTQLTPPLNTSQAWRRTLGSTLFGGCFLGPIGHLWCAPNTLAHAHPFGTRGPTCPPGLGPPLDSQPLAIQRHPVTIMPYTPRP